MGQRVRCFVVWSWVGVESSRWLWPAASVPPVSIPRKRRVRSEPLCHLGYGTGDENNLQKLYLKKKVKFFSFVTSFIHCFFFLFCPILFFFPSQRKAPRYAESRWIGLLLFCFFQMVILGIFIVIIIIIISLVFKSCHGCEVISFILFAAVISNNHPCFLFPHMEQNHAECFCNTLNSLKNVPSSSIK